MRVPTAPKGGAGTHCTEKGEKGVQVPLPQKGGEGGAGTHCPKKGAKGVQVPTAQRGEICGTRELTEMKVATPNVLLNA